MTAFHTDGTDREKRWMVLAATGQHSWLGRHSDPTDEELLAVSRAMAKLDMDAWLCVAEGNYWSDGYYAVLQVKLLNGNGKFDTALDEFMAKRRETLDQAGE